MRAVVLSDQRMGGGELVLNAKFLRFAAHWGVHPRACRPYRAQTKGKVERPIRYIRDSFCYGRAFAGDEDLNEQASRWVEGTANVRQHGTTGERPVDRFERDEREALRPMASRPYQRVGVQPAAAPTGVVARIVNGPHEANRQDPHLPMRYDTGRPRAVIRLRISQPRTASLPCPAGLRARRLSPMMDL